MGKSPRGITFGLLVATCALAIAAQAPVNLQISPKEGDVFRYAMTGELHVMGTTVQISADITYKITKVDQDRTYTMASSQTNTQAVFSGSTSPLPDSSNVTVNKINGELLDYQSESTDTVAWRMMELKHFVYPPKRVIVGDEWNSSVVADPKRGTVAAIGNYRLESLEKIGRRDTAKVKVSYKETEGVSPASSEGFVWIDTSDGSMVRSQTSWTNAPSPQGLVDAKITIERV